MPYDTHIFWSALCVSVSLNGHETNGVFYRKVGERGFRCSSDTVAWDDHIPHPTSLLPGQIPANADSERHEMTQLVGFLPPTGPESRLLAPDWPSPIAFRQYTSG